jgi:hypothetical protein
VTFYLGKCNARVERRLLLPEDDSLNESLAFLHESTGEEGSINPVRIPSSDSITDPHSLLSDKVSIFRRTQLALRNAKSISRKYKLVFLCRDDGRLGPCQ